LGNYFDGLAIVLARKKPPPYWIEGSHLKVSSLIARLQIDNADPARGDRAELRFRAPAAGVDCL
jgi:hypothetical protein